jgi:hypothetical protein
LLPASAFPYAERETDHPQKRMSPQNSSEHWGQTAETLERAEDAKRRAAEANGAEQRVQLRRVQDFKKLAGDAEHVM